MSTELNLKNDIIPRLKELLGVTKNTEVAKALDTYPQTLNGWMDRNSVPYTQLYKLAKDRNVSLTWILDGQGEQVKDVKSEDCNVSLKAVDSNESVTVSNEFLKSVLKMDAQNSAYYVVQSDSMEPLISNGDTLLLTTNTENAGDGIYVMKINSRISVCRLQFLPKSIKASNENSAYEQFEISYDDKFELLGRAVRKLGKIN
ncbi:hypothetical protein HG263_05305 [Pseudoalteromonas sp. JBTF-M23]|uniref:Phage repressor protein C with HTH and peptisase S24 domain n=1 Tax=Pseudoalteromonas caenipelagi TaxID=2726988 RepID=A0A849VDF0_9GAMM|nr:S24 family peptidase [Pseudoalteromonas caenipelagi]NOU49954.1 hypothetical protein [Pseudoalteromonas caenipelagi]